MIRGPLRKSEIVASIIPHVDNFMNDEEFEQLKAKLKGGNLNVELKEVTDDNIKIIDINEEQKTDDGLKSMPATHPELKREDEIINPTNI